MDESDRTVLEPQKRHSRPAFSLWPTDIKARILRTCRTAWSRQNWAERVALGLALCSFLWFAVAVGWEFFGPIGDGHVSAAAGIGLAAENMLSWKIVAPVMRFAATQPDPREYYCHHPWGMFWWTALVMRVFGAQDWVLRAAPVLSSLATPPLIYLASRDLFGKIPGAVAAAAFTVVPITLAFGDYNSLEVALTLGVALNIWGTTRLAKTWKRRYVAVSVLGLVLALLADWPAVVFAGVVLGCGLVRGIWLPSQWFPAIDIRRFWHWWALSVTVCALVLGFFVIEFQSAHQLVDLIQSGQWRSQGSAQPLSAVLLARRYWIELTFTPPVIALGKLALPVLLLRILLRKRDLEALPLAVLVMAVFQYVSFKQGADIHIFWPYCFALYFAYAMGALTATVESGARRVASAWKRCFNVPSAAILRWGSPAGVALFFGSLPVLSVLPDGVRGLLYARQSGKRFDEHGNLIHQDIDKATALRSYAQRLPFRTLVLVHQSMNPTWYIEWSLHRATQVASSVPDALHNRVLVLDSRFCAEEDLRQAAARFSVDAIGPFWFVVEGSPGIHGYALHHREPTLWERYFVQGNDPIYSVAPDPWVTWELGDHFGQHPPLPPERRLETPEHFRLAHNLAMATGRAGLATQTLEQLTQHLDGSVRQSWLDGSQLLGIAQEGGVAPRLQVFFLAPGPAPSQRYFAIRSVVEEKAQFSWVPADPKDRAVGMPFTLPTSLWKAGYIYAVESEIRRRPGRERFEGTFQESDGRPVSGAVSPVKLDSIN